MNVSESLQIQPSIGTATMKIPRKAIAVVRSQLALSVKQEHVQVTMQIEVSLRLSVVDLQNVVNKYCSLIRHSCLSMFQGYGKLKTEYVIGNLLIT
jgi:hypothetical protein